MSKKRKRINSERKGEKLALEMAHVFWRRSKKKFLFFPFFNLNGNENNDKHRVLKWQVDKHRVLKWQVGKHHRVLSMARFNFYLFQIDLKTILSHLHFMFSVIRNKLSLHNWTKTMLYIKQFVHSVSKQHMHERILIDICYLRFKKKHRSLRST